MTRTGFACLIPVLLMAAFAFQVWGEFYAGMKMVVDVSTALCLVGTLVSFIGAVGGAK